MKIIIEVSEANEGTDSPWWAIIDPKQNMGKDLGWAAGQVTGPFFSRQEAEDELKATHYNYGRRARVWCFSGYHSRQYKIAVRAAEAVKDLRAKMLADGCRLTDAKYVYLPYEVRGDGPFADTIAPRGAYVAHRNEFGAVSVHAMNGKALGVKCDEFVEVAL